MVSLRVLQNEAREGLLAEAAQILRERGVIAMPTESFYALGACPLDETAVR
ncbi:MAG: threonylcarbamoyl-AMP synthase, partial [Nitrospira sp.]|nr:threonylcarbamoyl-AMP synthase [Nitrospira sp.]